MSSEDRELLRAIEQRTADTMKTVMLPVRVTIGGIVLPLFVLLRSLLDRLEKLEGKKP
jgi:hypothetical protein